MVRLFSRTGRTNRVDFVAARIKGFGQPLDISSLARRVAPLVGHRNGNALFNNLALHL
jgi:hypothetical protein